MRGDCAPPDSCSGSCWIQLSPDSAESASRGDLGWHVGHIPKSGHAWQLMGIWLVSLQIADTEPQNPSPHGRCRWRTYWSVLKDKLYLRYRIGYWTHNTGRGNFITFRLSWTLICMKKHNHLLHTSLLPITSKKHTTYIIYCLPATEAYAGHIVYVILMTNISHDYELVSYQHDLDFRTWYVLINMF